MDKATFGGGCFWCTEAIFQDLIGVESVVSGYAGGQSERPTYRDVCAGDTGHAEVIQVTYDPAVIGYDELVDIFFRTHDPTTLNRQGHDVGSQYRSIILYHNEEQRATAEAKKAELTAARLFADPIVTEIVPLATFFPAEEYHQEYYRNNPYQAYCMAVIDPKVRKFRKSYQNRLKNAI
jgi:peptide-methionine (S)-S-oxide reductase